MSQEHDPDASEVQIDPLVATACRIVDHVRTVDVLAAAELLPWVAAQVGPPDSAMRHRFRRALDEGASWSTAWEEAVGQPRRVRFFHGTLRHVIAPDVHMHVALEGQELAFVPMASQFRVGRSPPRYDPPPPPFLVPADPGWPGEFSVGPHERTAAAHGRDVPEHPIAAEGWFARGTVRVPAEPASAVARRHPSGRVVDLGRVRRASVTAVPHGLVVNHLEVELELDQERMRLAVLGIAEMWACLGVLQAALGERVVAPLRFSPQAWALLPPR